MTTKLLTLEDLLRMMVDRGGSDLHVTAGSPPRIRVDGELLPIDEEKLMPETSQQLVYSILNNEQIARFEKNLELDLSFGISGLGRFRVNVFQQRGAVGAVMRIIPWQVRSVKELGLPQQMCEHLCMLPKGLILITGATGSGKSTTLAAMVDYINNTRNAHVVTIEDPIEFVHKNKKCLFNQREVGTDTHSFGAALRSVLREDPDVILIGEMRDMETIESALTLAETGHLVFGTLHTSDCVQTINRVIDVFPAYQQAQIRTQFSFTLQAVFCQQLLARSNGKGRVLAAEIMIANAAIRALIRDDKGHQIYSMIQTGGKEGMKTMNASLFELYRGGHITYEEALAHSTDTEDLRLMFQRKM
ncbi:MAG TPA: type IV pilus twitching motility protein PilT [Planctomycetota bacterium]|nr:type IV pilus twitching motility protein PilT [Planctomycetota bacterium]